MTLHRGDSLCEADGTGISKRGRVMRRIVAGALVIAAAMAPAIAQQSGGTSQPGVTQRVDRLEREMRAVQRKVFPGSEGQQIFEPEIAPAPNAAPGGTPASSPIDDLTSRVSALEAELQRLTEQNEQQGFRLRQLEEAQTRQKTETDARLTALEGGAPPAASSPPGGSAGSAAAGNTAPAPRPNVGGASPPPAAPPSRPPANNNASNPPAPTPVPAAGPPTGDPAEDAYLAGYRQWVAHQYDDAATTLRAVVQRYPNHRRASYAQNLLGRSLLDSGHPAQAAEAFYANYQRMPRGERAPDSLYYLGQSLMALNPPKASDACKVYEELIDVYGGTIDTALRGRVTAAQTAARCAPARPAAR